jgi:hypothetical protein
MVVGEILDDDSLAERHESWVAVGLVCLDGDSGHVCMSPCGVGSAARHCLGLTDRIATIAARRGTSLLRSPADQGRPGKGANAAVSRFG